MVGYINKLEYERPYTCIRVKPTVAKILLFKNGKNFQFDFYNQIAFLVF